MKSAAWKLKTYGLLCVVGCVLSFETLVIQTKKGQVKGKTVETAAENHVDVWYGIPYAQPPLGDLRFRHPRQIQPWQGIKETTELPNSCIQVTDTFFGDFDETNKWNPNTLQSEDCLYLNVIVPKPRPTNAAVIVWIYGGGFYSGTSTLDIYDYKILASEQNVVIVAPQYRVASLGFLYMGTPDAPGNTGLFDQLMALQWVKDNIANFGGNPENVTIMGESAGATSVSMHLLSPLSQSLFSQAIMESGSATVPWGTLEPEESILRGLTLAAAVGCPHSREDISAVMECLRNSNSTKLVKNEPSNSICDFPFVPVVDGVFFIEKPIDTLKKGNFKKTNILMGSNTEEGYWFIMYYLTDTFTRKEGVKVTKAQYEKAVRELFPYLSDVAREAIMYEYRNWLDPEDGDHNRNAIDKMVGDYHFTCNVNEFAYYYAKFDNNVYMYYFKHRSTQNGWPKWMGVLHGDEISFLFGQPLNPKYSYSQEEIQLSSRMMSYWANFAKTGNPTQRPHKNWDNTFWPVHTVKGREYLVLATNTTDEIGRGPRLKKCAFWKNFLPQLIKNEKENALKGPQQCPSTLKCPTSASHLVIVNSLVVVTTALTGVAVCYLSIKRP